MSTPKIAPLNGALNLIAAWTERNHDGNASSGPIVTGVSGHRNTSGAKDADAISFSRHNALFDESLEPGVRDLVYAIINCLDCVTFTSCEGHLDDSGTDLSSYRNVGIFSRSAEEDRFIDKEMTQVVTRALAGWTGEACIVIEWREIMTESGERPFVEIRIDPNALVPSAYFEQADSLTLRLIAALEQQPQT